MAVAKAKRSAAVVLPPSPFPPVNLPTSSQNEPPPAPIYDLEYSNWYWHTEYGYAIAEGEVKNISGKRMKNVTAVVSFYDKDGNFITSDEALIDYNPILPGQISPFKVMATENPAMEKGRLQFKYLFGETISYKKKQ